MILIKEVFGKWSDIDIFITFAYLYSVLVNTDGRKKHKGGFMGFSETKTELFQADAENSGLMISLRSMIVIILSMTTPLAVFSNSNDKMHN